ncbi:MAG: DNA repair protein RecN, partial [Deltaproteobacteria bacterium]|nr:DNA repair protein RecN [Deltaproteobacteria bacterium]
ALFTVESSAKVRAKLADSGIDAHEELVIRRVISDSGKNKVFINGVMATLAMLTDVCEGLINISGQHEHQVLLQPENHLDLLDSFGKAESLKARYEEAYKRYGRSLSELEHLMRAEKSRAERADLVSFQLDELEKANIEKGEDESLGEERKVLLNAEKLAGAATFGDELIYSSEDSIVGRLGEVLSRLKACAPLDSKLKAPEEAAENALFQLEDAALTLREYAGNMTFDPARLAAVEERLADLERLKKKYGPTLDDLIKTKESLALELDSFEGAGKSREALEARVAKEKEEALNIAGELSALRREASKRLSREVVHELGDLGINGAALEVVFRDLGGLKEKGLEEAEFFLSANPGEAPRALAKTASGGELSRLMLAFKQRTLGKEKVPSLIFDEVDAGIGGGTAEVVGKKLKSVSKNSQVICITHLPQIAALGDSHYKVAKRVEGGRTFTSIDILSPEERVDELSRMLGGVEITEMTKKHAREMLSKNA